MVPSNEGVFITTPFTTLDHFSSIRTSAMRVTLLIPLLLYFSPTCWVVETSLLDPAAICPSIPGLTSRQVRYCQSYPWIMNSIQRALESAREQCTNQFSRYGGTRWNCSTSNSDSVFKPILRAATKEAAFAWAITAAGVVAGVARDCKMNLLKECGCRRGDNPKSVKKTTGEQEDWEGCSDDVMLGNIQAKKYIRASIIPKENVDFLAIHNAEVGRRFVRRMVSKECKCHGVSGSCALRTCWTEVPDMKSVGDALRTKYEKAERVNVVDGADRKRNKKLELTSEGNATPKRNDLVYEDTSPPYCSHNSLHFYLGTEGRSCNVTSALPDGCRHLCCGRGYDKEKYKEEYACECEFEWCCRVVCQTCTREIVKYVCK
ncbi:protein Wnt-5b-like isoform X2 [Corticium candelabrum]|uniref:protein Wnt-5b-like isoform X2 n=1 Tax=Corticium candelabrum TaxID=121492 RepID=UPI002E269D3D|nr:protein Wnt-5b-like isoform X2 [Corticium candelabrum]